MFLGVPFVPAPQTLSAYQSIAAATDIPEQLKEKCKKFEEYFVQTWLCGNYTADIWTHFRSEFPRTNNTCEGYNNRLSKRAVITHPSIFALIKLLREEQSNKIAYIAQIDGGNKREKRRKIHIQTDDNLGLSYMLCEIDIATYIYKCAEAVRGNI